MVKKIITILIVVVIGIVAAIVLVLVVLNNGNATVTVGGVATPTTIHKTGNEGILGSNKYPVPGDPCALLKKATALVKSVGKLKAPPTIQTDFVNQCTLSGVQGEVTLLAGHAHGLANTWLSKADCKPEVIRPGVKSCTISHSLHEGDSKPGAGIVLWAKQFDVIVFVNGTSLSEGDLQASAAAIAQGLQ